jgi:hypothetical protein
VAALKLVILKWKPNQMRKKMWEDPVRIFLWSAGVLLFVAAAAKITSSFGQAPVFNLPDPILAFSFRKVLVIVGLVELCVAVICFFGGHTVIKAVLVAALASSIAIYRFGLMLIDYHGPCHCLGSLTGMLHIPEKTADVVMKIVLGYLLTGSIATLLWLWRQNQKALKLPPSV